MIGIPSTEQWHVPSSYARQVSGECQHQATMMLNIRYAPHEFPMDVFDLIGKNSRAANYVEYNISLALMPTEKSFIRPECKVTGVVRNQPVASSSVAGHVRHPCISQHSIQPCSAVPFPTQPPSVSFQCKQVNNSSDMHALRIMYLVFTHRY